MSFEKCQFMPVNLIVMSNGRERERENERENGGDEMRGRGREGKGERERERSFVNKTLVIQRVPGLRTYTCPL